MRAATDITGFGLVGHAAGIARESALTLEIEARALPLPASALGSADPPSPSQSAGLTGEPPPSSSPSCSATPGPDEAALRAILFDPQTSGGLLLLVPPANRDAVLAELPHARAIGVARAAGDHPIVVL